MNNRRILVNMGEGKCANLDESLAVIGLGSCIALVIYDDLTRIAAMAHIMLPSSIGFKNIKPYKFADTAPQLLINDLKEMKANMYNLKCKITGGAFMFRTISPKTDITRIGERNIIETRKALRKVNVKLVSQEVGGAKGRTVEFFPHSSEYVIKTIGEKPIII